MSARDRRFAGTTVVVTGAGSGIGAQTVRRFAAEGAAVVVADINVPAAQAVAASIPGALAVEVDVTRRSSLKAMVTATEMEFGGIDVLINNALSCSESPFLAMGDAEILQDFAVNAMGPFMACQEAIPAMVARGGGVILNVASVNALASFGNVAYSAAKAALISLTHSIAFEFGGQGIRCNAVAPGTVDTEHWAPRLARDPHLFERAARWYPTGRVGNTDDIANALLFLASSEAAWINGATLPVEGGLLSGNLGLSRELAGDDEPQ
ncbi:SDR family NAD(P)-dependent oxidoreductase [Pseudarthrobacter sp. P1]|uniref:SDR family NAD(P)-dependent oxidoreductase n=1 Tax=Pseudarthrobacter sp. P1 TaxID=3418418 RepID=UPI003CF4B85E